MIYSNFEERLDSLIEDLSPEDRATLIIRLLIFLKLNVLEYYVNCKDCIDDPLGKHLMEYLTDSQRKYLSTLDRMVPYLPDSLQEEYIELSRLMYPLDSVDVPGIAVLDRMPAEPDEDDFMLEVMDEAETSVDNDIGAEAEDHYIQGSIEQKGWELKMIQKLSSCLHDNTCSEVFTQIMEEEKYNQELLMTNFNRLRNTGKWYGV